MKTILLVVVITLLVSVVGYLAMDRAEKNAAAQHSRDFKGKYLK